MKKELSERIKVIDKSLDLYLPEIENPQSVIYTSMRYSVFAGGKRLRPILMWETAKLFDKDWESVREFACALEMIHTYSLIHDDLPAMDNDDFRRGKPSNHKAFGEGNAILAGDGLLNEAYAICLTECMKGENCVMASRFLNECAGIYGICFSPRISQ